MVIDWLKVETFEEHLVRRQARQKHINGTIELFQSSTNFLFHGTNFRLAADFKRLGIGNGVFR